MLWNPIQKFPATAGAVRQLWRIKDQILPAALLEERAMEQDVLLRIALHITAAQRSIVSARSKKNPDSIGLSNYSTTQPAHSNRSQLPQSFLHWAHGFFKQFLGSLSLSRFLGFSSTWAVGWSPNLRPNAQQKLRSFVLKARKCGFHSRTQAQGRWWSAPWHVEKDEHVQSNLHLIEEESDYLELYKPEQIKMLLHRVQLSRTNSFPKWRAHEIFRASKPHIWERPSRGTLTLNMKSERESLLQWPYSKNWTSFG